MKRTIGTETMGRKKSAVPSKAVKIHLDVHEKAVIVAGYEKKDLTKYLSDVLRPIVEASLVKNAEETIKARDTTKPKAKPRRKSTAKSKARDGTTPDKAHE
jgi:hypothetical protein